MIKTGIKFFGLNIYLDSTGDDDVDQAAKSVFHDHFTRTRPLTIATRLDVRIMLAWGQKKMVPRKFKHQPKQIPQVTETLF